MIKKFVILLLCFFAMVCFLTGCSSSNEENGIYFYTVTEVYKDDEGKLTGVVLFRWPHTIPLSTDANATIGDIINLNGNENSIIDACSTGKQILVQQEKENEQFVYTVIGYAQGGNERHIDKTKGN